MQARKDSSLLMDAMRTIPCCMAKTDKNQNTVRDLNGKRLLAAGGIKKNLIEMLESELYS